MMASFGHACILLVIVTGNTFSAGSKDMTLNTSPLRDSRIDNNKQATIWLSSLQEPTTAPVFRCTGTIISRQHVLTAATCATGLRQKALVISEAKDHLSDSRSFSPVLETSVSSEHDMVVLRVRDSFFPSSSVMQLLGEEIHIATDDKCSVSGWFPSSDLWTFEGVLFLSNEDCSVIYNQLTTTPFNDKHVCSVPEVGNATCTVGLGWPLVCDSQLTGIFTWTHHSCEQPSVYASVESAMPWIATFRGVGSTNIASVVLTLVAVLVWTIL